jgi:hypothetical protein
VSDEKEVSSSEVPSRHRVWLFVVLLFVGLGFAAWASDTITLEGERPIYTADCVAGTWQGPRCTGRLSAGPRYRFRALRAHKEVLFWTAGASGASGKYTDCDIKDGRNWSCAPNADATRTIVHEMLHGRPVRDPSVPALGFHQVPKWKWWALRLGLPVGSEAED